MSIWKLTVADIEAVVTQVKAGRSLEQVAQDLEMSVEMVFCAVRQGDRLRSPWLALWPAL